MSQTPPTESKKRFTVCFSFSIDVDVAPSDVDPEFGDEGDAAQANAYKALDAMGVDGLPCLEITETYET